MKRVIAAIVVIFMATGCAYQKAAEVQQSARQSHAMSLTNLPEAFSKAIAAVTKAFEGEAQKQTVVQQNKLLEKTYYDATGKQTHTETVYAPVSELAAIMIAEKKQKTMEMLFQALRDIYEYKPLEQINAMTWEQVAFEFVKNGPLMLAIGGLWGLGVDAVANVGDQINNGNIANGGSTIDDSVKMDLRLQSPDITN